MKIKNVVKEEINILKVKSILEFNCDTVPDTIRTPPNLGALHN